MIYLGVDPGASGAIVALDADGQVIDICRLDQTPHDVADWIYRVRCNSTTNTRAAIEKVGVMPGQGLASSGKFMRAAGMIEGMIVAFKIPYQLVTPSKWQRDLRVTSPQGTPKGVHKRKLKAEAQRRWPSSRWTLKDCDAALIAAWLREFGR